MTLMPTLSRATSQSCFFQAAVQTVQIAYIVLQGGGRKLKGDLPKHGVDGIHQSLQLFRDLLGPCRQF